MAVASTGVERPVPRWSSISTRKSCSARSSQPGPRGRPVGRAASKPGPPCRKTRNGLSQPSGSATSRAKTVICSPSGRAWSSGTENSCSVRTSPAQRWLTHGLQEAEEPRAPALARVDRREVPGAVEHLGLDAAARRRVALEHGADLRHHRLRRERPRRRASPGSRPAARASPSPTASRRRSTMSCVPCVHRIGGLGSRSTIPAQFAVLGRERVEDPARAGRDAGPVLGRSPCRRGSRRRRSPT